MEYYLKDSVCLRIVRFALPSGQQEVLLTNILDGLTVKELKDIYGMRWQVEECYKRLKQVAHVEYFSGRSPLSIKQDYFARIVMLNIASMMETQKLGPDLKKSKNSKGSLQKQINRTQVYAKLKDNIYRLVRYDPDYELQRILSYLEKAYDVIRPNRHFPRPKCFKHRRKKLQYKAA